MNSNHPMATKASKSFFWYSGAHTNTIPENSNNKKDENLFERLKIQSIAKTSSMLAIRTEQKLRNYKNGSGGWMF